jgi:hypothetical protein
MRDAQDSQWPGPERRVPRPEKWHIKREFQLGHLITTMAMAVSVIMYIGKMEQRIALVEQSVTVQRERDDRQDKAIAEALQAIERRLGKLDDKLDRVLYQSRTK